MKIKVTYEKDEKMKVDEVEILVKSHTSTEDVDNLIEYIKKFEDKQHQKFLINNNNLIEEIDFQEVICFYSDKKYNYCKTKNAIYKIKSKLYEIENMNENFIRLSKGCIANYNHIKCFDITETGRIIVIFDDDSKEYVSRRKIKSIMKFLDERSVWYGKGKE